MTGNQGIYRPRRIVISTEAFRFFIGCVTEKSLSFYKRGTKISPLRVASVGMTTILSESVNDSVVEGHFICDLSISGSIRLRSD